MKDASTALVRQGHIYLFKVAQRLGRFFILLCTPVVALCLTACGPGNETPSASVRPVKCFTVKPAHAGLSTVLTGDIHSHDEILLAFRLEGRISERSADVGNVVKAGELLATLDNSSAINSVNNAQADVDSARAELHVSSLSFQRMKSLISTGAIARVQMDNAQADQITAESRLKSSEASLRNAKDSLNWTELRAPADGIITAVNASAGQVVTAGQTVMSLASGNGRDIVLNIPDPTSFPTTKGKVFNISLIDNAAVTATAHLRDISPQADTQTRSWRVRLTIDNPPARMLLGSSVNVSVPGSNTSVINIPASALTRLDSKPAVFIINENQKKVFRRAVVIAQYSADEAYITSGINPGEKIVTAGVSLLRDGESVSAGDNDQ